MAPRVLVGDGGPFFVLMIAPLGCPEILTSDFQKSCPFL
jgi:hypothetical protein